MIVGAGNLYETINNKAKHANFDVEILPPREDISKLFRWMLTFFYFVLCGRALGMLSWNSMAHGVTPVVVDCPWGTQRYSWEKYGYIAQQTPESVAEKIKIAKMSPIPKSLLKSRSNDYSADTISLDYIRLIKD